ncbi:MAG: glutaredoxin family protein [Cyanobium sp. MAG06]|nr:glutaredoxin family protein [Cyanobium sp. MAG06]
MDSHKIAYTNYDVSTDTAKREEMMDMTGQLGVPVIKIGNDVIIGFDQDKIKDLLGVK